MIKTARNSQHSCRSHSDIMEKTGKRYASGIVLICNISGVTVTILAGMLVATTEKVEEEHHLQVRGLNVHLKQLNPKVQEHNEELPMLLEEKIKHLNADKEEQRGPHL